jgi:hypothetical protein
VTGEVVASIITGVLGLVAGTVGFYFANRYLERRREYLSTKREQLQYVFAPLDVLLKINKREFDRYFKEETTDLDREFIEKNVWYPNNLEIKRIIMEKSHLLGQIPEEILQLLSHINVWLSEYELIYVKRVKSPPVFGGPKGYGYPHGVDEYIYSQANELRRMLTR